jgi:hypothetical protein
MLSLIRASEGKKQRKAIRSLKSVMLSVKSPNFDSNLQEKQAIKSIENRHRKLK